MEANNPQVPNPNFAIFNMPIATATTTANFSAIEELKAEVERLKTAIEELRGNSRAELTALEDRLKTEAQIAKRDLEAEVQDLRTKFGNADDGVSSLKTDVGKVTAEVDDLKRDMAALKDDVEDVKGK